MNPPDQPTTYAYEWHITVKADEPAGAIDALFNCIRSFQSGAEPIGGTCPASMGNRMTYDVIKDGKPTPTPSLAPTPRTQKQLLPINSHTLPGDVVYADFARTLERELAETERLRFGADADRRRLRCELAAAKAEALHYMAVAQKATDELIFFRADNLKAHQMTCAAALERDRLRAEVERLKVEDTDWELAFQAATQLIADSEAELAAANKRIADCEFLLEHRYKIIQQQEPRCNEAIARAEKAEAERDRADAEVAALKKVLLEFGQLPSTQP